MPYFIDMCLWGVSGKSIDSCHTYINVATKNDQFSIFKAIYRQQIVGFSGLLKWFFWNFDDNDEDE